MPRFRSHVIPSRLLPDSDRDRSAADDISEQDGIEIPGHTLGEFILNLESRAGIRLTPEKGEKYFRLAESDTGSEIIVDVHIMRDGMEICPKQDADFALEPDDVVEAGILVC